MSSGATCGMLTLLKILFPTTKPLVFVEQFSYWSGLRVPTQYCTA